MLPGNSGNEVNINENIFSVHMEKGIRDTDECWEGMIQSVVPLTRFTFPQMFPVDILHPAICNRFGKYHVEKINPGLTAVVS